VERVEVLLGLVDLLVVLHASGIIMSIAWASDRPPRLSSSTTSSKDAESEASGCRSGTADPDLRG
jgi:hypothetical protein